MSMYAYTAKTRKEKEKRLARNLTSRDRGVRFYCPNKKCDAHMFIHSRDGEERQYFAASGKYGHIEFCPYGSQNTFRPEDTQEDGFYFEDAVCNMMEPGQKRNEQRQYEHKTEENAEKQKIIPHTVKQIYDMCKSYDCLDTFNGQMIGKILVDSRSIYMYTKGIFGYKLIEAKCRPRLYDREKMQIYLETPIDEKKYNLLLQFKDMELFRTVKDLLYNNRDHVIGIVGKWERADQYDCFVTEFACRKQIKVMKQTI